MKVWTLGKFKQKWDLAYHARSRPSSMFALKLWYEVEVLAVSKRSRDTCISHMPAIYLSWDLIHGQGLERDR